MAVKGLSEHEERFTDIIVRRIGSVSYRLTFKG